MSAERIGRSYARLATVAVAFGLLQAAIETIAVAVLYRDLIFAPYRFFTLQIYDAFTKLYFSASSVLPLPVLLDVFLGAGVLEKLRLLGDLASVNVVVGSWLALVLLPVAPRVGVYPELEPRRYVVRALVLIAGVCLAVHAVIWALSVKIPLDPTPVKIATNLARDAVADGVAVAAAVCVLAAVCAALLARSPRASTFALAVAVAAVAATEALDWRTADAAASAGAPDRGSEARAPAHGHNVVLISIDSLRADHLGAYGYERETSPALDRLAHEGVLFEHCSSTTSWTLPAHMSLLTGRSLLGHGVVGDDRRLDDGVPTLAEAFKAAGYATGAIVSAPYVSSRYGFARGFDEYDDRTVAFETNEDSYKSVTAPLVNAAAEKWIGARAGRPFFLFLHYWDVHYDYAPGAPYDRLFDPDYDGDVSGLDFYFSRKVHPGMQRRDLDHVLALYDGEIRLVDDHIARLREVLESRGLLERTVIAVTADHGDEFFEHGEKGHHRTLYEEVLRVPCIVRLGGSNAGGGAGGRGDGVVTPFAGRRISAEASIIDLAPTLLGLTGVAAPRGLEGVDFTPVLIGTAAEPARTTFAELYRKGSLNVQVAALDERHKLIHHFNARRLETYDLAADPAERAPLGADAALAATMRGWLEERWRAYRLRESAHGVARVETDRKTQDMLRALGYVE